MNPSKWLIPAAAALWLFCAHAVFAAAPSSDALMSESFQQFDQKMDTGWRTLQLKGDYLGAADAILRYRTLHAAELDDWQKGSLAFHLGHCYAMAGETAKAIAAFRDALASGGWGNPAYIEGFIAFLQGDKTTLMDARHAIAATNPGPWQKDDLAEMDAMLTYFGQPFEAAWAALNCHDPGIKTDTPEWAAYCHAADRKYRNTFLAHGVKLPE